MYKKIADKNDCIFLAASDIASPSKADLEHLDEKGHEELANAVYKLIRKQVVNR